MKLTVICLMVVFVLSLGTIGCDKPSSSGLPEKVQVRLKWRHQVQFAGFYLAKNKRLYAAQKMDVTLLPRDPAMTNHEIAEELVSEKSQFAIMSGDFLLAERAGGAPIVAIAVIFQRNPYVYATLKQSGIHRPQDLINKTIMIPPDGKIQHEALMKKLGIDERRIDYFPYERDSTALADGRIDAQMVYRTGSGLALEAQGNDLSFIWLDEYGIRLYADAVVTTEKMAMEKPDVVEGFLRASLQGWRYAIEKPEAAISTTLAVDTGLDRDVQKKIIAAQTPLIHTGDHPIGWMEPSVWKDMQEILRIPVDSLEITHAYTMDFLNRIYEGQGQTADP